MKRKFLYFTSNYNGGEDMKYVRVTTRGRITIPAAMRRRLNINAGTKIIFLSRGDKIIAVPMEKKYSRTLPDVPR